MSQRTYIYNKTQNKRYAREINISRIESLILENINYHWVELQKVVILFDIDKQKQEIQNKHYNCNQNYYFIQQNMLSFLLGVNSSQYIK